MQPNHCGPLALNAEQPAAVGRLAAGHDLVHFIGLAVAGLNETHSFATEDYFHANEQKAFSNHFGGAGAGIIFNCFGPHCVFKRHTGSFQQFLRQLRHHRRHCLLHYFRFIIRPITAVFLKC